MCLFVYVRSGHVWPGETTERPRECDPSKEMRCKDGQCILLRRKCDNIFDCLDGSDEHDCGKLPLHPVRSFEWSLHFQCLPIIFLIE